MIVSTTALAMIGLLASDPIQVNIPTDGNEFGLRTSSAPEPITYRSRRRNAQTRMVPQVTVRCERNLVHLDITGIAPVEPYPVSVTFKVGGVERSTRPRISGEHNARIVTAAFFPARDLMRGLAQGRTMVAEVGDDRLTLVAPVAAARTRFTRDCAMGLAGSQGPM